MWIPKETLLCILSEKPKLFFPFLLRAALNIISNECANLVAGVSQDLLISKPACITVNISCLFFICRIKMMKAALFSYDLEKTVWGQDSGTTLPIFFYFSFFYVVFSLTLSLGAPQFTTVIHSRYFTLLHWPLWRTSWVCAQSLSHVRLCDPCALLFMEFPRQE